MIGDKLPKLVEDLKSVFNEQQFEAKKQLDAMPEGAQKEQLKALLKQVSSGKSDLKDVQDQLKNILSNGN